MSSSPRTVIVTGASAGVGRAIALRYAEAGDRVGLIARDAEALEDAVSQIRAGGGTAAAESADVSDAEALFAASDRLQGELGPVDIWVNDAMETVFSPFVEITPKEYRRVTEVTYLGFVHGVMAALKVMRPRRQGVIIQIGSALSYRAVPLQSAYCGAKFAIRGFTDAVRTELMHEGSPVKLIMVQLPAVNTPQFDWARAHTSRTPRPVGSPVEPEVVADAVFRACQGRWREYWLGYPTWMSIIGNIVAPGLLDRYLASTAVEGQQTPHLVSPDRPDNLEHPVTDLHRTRGSFEAEALNSAPMAPGEVLRGGAVAGGALVFFVLGMVVNAARGRRRG